MGRILAIDYGRKRVGLAVTDPCGIIATGLQTVPAHEVLVFLQQYITKEKVDLFVVGHPKQMDNSDSESMQYIKPFLKALKRKFSEIPVEMYDERFTSVLAHKALIDTMSATIILTSYMEYRRNFKL